MHVYKIYSDVHYTPQGDTRTSTHGLASISIRRCDSHITQAVAAMDSCFTFIKVYQRDLAVRPLYGQNRFQRLLGPKALHLQNSKDLLPLNEASRVSYHDDVRHQS